MSATLDLGLVTAYGYAKDGGFTGTEAQFEAMLANVETYRTLSESYAKGGTGTRTGENTDNAKYYKEQAEQAAQEAASHGVQSFNTRTGVVNSAAGDYTAAQVTYSNTTSGLSAVTTQAAIDEVDGNLDTAITKMAHYKDVTISATASSGTVGGMDYTHTQTVSWTGMTANDEVRLYITSGTYDDDIAVDSQSGQCVIYFGSEPTTLTTVRLVANAVYA